MNVGLIVFLISSGVSIFLLIGVIFFIAWKQIIAKIKVMLGRNRDRGVIVEIKDNKSFKIHVEKLTGKNLKLGDRYYDINPDHYLISDDYSSKGLIVSENLKASMNPKNISEDFKALDSDSLNSLIKRAIVDGQNGIFDLIEKIKQFLPMVLLLILGYMGITLFFLFKIWNGGAKII